MESFGFEVLTMIVDNTEPGVGKIFGSDGGLAYHTFGLASIKAGLDNFEAWARSLNFAREGRLFSGLQKHGLDKILHDLSKFIRPNHCKPEGFH